MSQRTKKVESVVHQIVAAELAQLPNSAHLTVTGVQVTPDLRQATVWIGVIASNEEQAETLFGAAEEARRDLQEAVASQLKSKFVPHLTLRRDAGGEYAQHITRLIRGL